jgi:hypothetical protein
VLASRVVDINGGDDKSEIKIQRRIRALSMKPIQKLDINNIRERKKSFELQGYNNQSSKN